VAEGGSAHRGKTRLRKVLPLRVKRVEDMARIAAASISMGQPSYFIRLAQGDRVILGMLAVFRDYYSLYGVPLFYYIECGGDEGCVKSSYVAFKLDELGESVEYTNSNKPGTVMIPIIELAEPPSFIEV